MKNYLIALFTLFCLYSCNDDTEFLNMEEESVSSPISSRSTTGNLDCGTVASEPPAWYFGIQTRALDDNIYTLNVYVHVIRSSNGVGFNKESVSQTVINNLNNYYAAAKINFFLVGSDYIDSDRYNNSDTSLYKEICNQNFHSNAIDIYILSDGSNWKETAGIARDIRSSACVIQSTYYNIWVLAHEVGHCLGLYHTHHGTAKGEDGIPELVDGSNSATAGDFITDTPADPCEWAAGFYIGTGRDANGDLYRPDPTNLMSYSEAYNQNKFTPGQIALMRGVILQEDIVKATIHQKQIIGPKHFSKTANYSVDCLNTDENVTWKVTAYTPGKSTNLTYTTSTLTLSSTESTYYEIVAQVASSGGTKSLVSFATANAPSPYIGDLYWETNDGQFSITNSLQYGNALHVSKNFTLTMKYTDKAGNNSQTLSNFDFICVTAANRSLRGKTFALTPNDCTDNLMIRVKDACGTSGDFFTIPCELANYYYNMSVVSDKIIINRITVNNEELPAGYNLLVDEEKQLDIKSVLVYTEDQQVVYSNDMIDDTIVRIETGSWNAGTYYLSISDGENVQYRKVRIS